MTERTEIDDLFTHCGVLVGALARKVRKMSDEDIYEELDYMSKRLAEVSKEFRTKVYEETQEPQEPQEPQKLGLYNDHKLDYGVQPRSDVAWTLQTK